MAAERSGSDARSPGPAELAVPSSGSIAAERGASPIHCSINAPLRAATNTRALTAALGGAAVLILSAALGACGEGGDGNGAEGGEVIEHVHGLGVNPADGSLFIATHHGLFHSPEGSKDAWRVGSGSQDTMGFTVAGPDRFLASGHPGPGEDGPSSLGLIESTDTGHSWQEVSLAGEADFHVLRNAHDRIYAVNALTGLLMLSDDGGETWTERDPPAAVIDLAVDPDDPQHIITSTEAGLAISTDEGRSWRPLAGDVGLLAWPAQRRLYLVDGAGTVQASENRGGRWRHVGNLGSQVAALTAVDRRVLYAALVDGSVLQSTDGGASWEARVEQ